MKRHLSFSLSLYFLAILLLGIGITTTDASIDLAVTDKTVTDNDIGSIVGVFTQGWNPEGTTDVDCGTRNFFNITDSDVTEDSFIVPTVKALSSSNINCIIMFSHILKVENGYFLMVASQGSVGPKNDSSLNYLIIKPAIP